MTTRRVAIACASVALIATSAAAVIQMRPYGYRASALVRVGRHDRIAPVARATDPNFVLFPHHYDGAYFYAIARDPFARGLEHRLIDDPAYRYTHPGFGWLGWALSLGQPAAVPAVLLALLLLCAAAAAAVASRLAADLGMTPWLGLAVALSPGLLFSATVLTSEPADVLAVLAGLLLWRRGRLGWAAVAFVAACLLKEQLVLVPAGLALYEFVSGSQPQKGARRPRAETMRRIVLLAAGPIALGLWYGYVWNRFGVFPGHEAHHATGVPQLFFTGWIESFAQAATLASASATGAQIGSTTLVLLLCLGAWLVVGIVRSLQLNDEVSAVFFPLALLAFCLSPLELLYPKDLLRVTALQLVLLPFLLARRAPPTT